MSSFIELCEAIEKSLAESQSRIDRIKSLYVNSLELERAVSQGRETRGFRDHNVEMLETVVRNDVNSEHYARCLTSALAEVSAHAAQLKAMVDKNTGQSMRERDAFMAGAASQQ